jgi:hypothetical protein
MGMRRRALAIVVGVLALAAVAAGAVQAHRRRELAPFAKLTRTYLERALAGDSLGVRALAADDTAAAAALALARRQPERVRAALQTMRVASGGATAAEAAVFFRTGVDWCAGAAGETDLQASFRPVGGGAWRVRHAGPGYC